MQNFENVVILAAGLGSRLGKNIPKCLLELGGKRLIEYQLYLLKDIKNIFMVVGFKDDEVIEFTYKIRKDIIFIRNIAYEKTGTLQSLLLATNIIRKPVLVLDADIVMDEYNFSLFQQECKKYNFTKTVIGITKINTDNPVFAILDKHHGAVHSFSRIVKSDYEFSGPCYIVEEIISEKKKSYIFELLSDTLPINYSNIEIFEIDTPNDYLYAQKHFISIFNK